MMVFKDMDMKGISQKKEHKIEKVQGQSFGEH